MGIYCNYNFIKRVNIATKYLYIEEVYIDFIFSLFTKPNAWPSIIIACLQEKIKQSKTKEV